MREVYKTFNSGRAVFFLMVFISCIIGAAVLKIAATVILPFTISVLLAFVMYPMIQVLDKIHCPRYVSILIVIATIVAGLCIFGIVLFTSARMIVDHLPQYESRVKVLYDWIANQFDLPNNEALSIWQNLWDQQAIRTFIRNFTFSFSNMVFRFATNAVLVILFVVFLLLEASFFKEKLDAAFENRSVKVNKMGRDLMLQVTRYLTAKFFISLANGIIFAVSFKLIGLEFAIVWGIIQFLLNFIPNLGSITSGVAIGLFSLIQFWPDPVPVVMVVIVILAVNLILCNIFDPKIVGEHVGISPLVILVSLAIWGWIWGFAGMVLAVPMTVIIKILCENIPIMEPVSIMLGTRRSVNAKKAEREKRDEKV